MWGSDGGHFAAGVAAWIYDGCWAGVVVLALPVALLVSMVRDRL